MKILFTILTLACAGYGLNANAAAGTASAAEAESAGAKVLTRTSITVGDRDIHPTGFFGFKGEFDHDGTPCVVRTVTADDLQGIKEYWTGVTHGAVTSADRLDAVIGNQMVRVSKDNFYAWTVIRGMEKDGVEGPIQAVLMAGVMPTVAGYNPADSEHAELLKVFTEHCGVDYSGGDPKAGARKDNQGIATMQPAFSDELRAEPEKAARFLRAGVEMLSGLKAWGLTLPREGTVPAAVVSVIDPALKAIHEAAGFTVIDERWVSTMVAPQPAEGEEDTRPRRALGIFDL